MPNQKELEDGPIVGWLITVDGVELYFPVEDMPAEKLAQWRGTGLNPVALCVKQGAWV